MFSPPANQGNMPPSPDRLELKENHFNYTLEPPSPGRLALKGIETDEENAKNSNDEPVDDTAEPDRAELEDNEDKTQIDQLKGNANNDFVR